MIVVAIIGILAALAIPNFIKFQAKSKQSEAKTNLKAIFSSARAHFAERDTFGNFSAMGYSVERGNRYAYTADSPVGESETRETNVPIYASTAGGYDQIQVDCFRLIGGACTTSTPGAPAPGGNFAYTQSTLTAQTGVTPPAQAPGLVRGGHGSVVFQAVGNVDNDLGADVWELGLGVTILPTVAVCSETSPSPTGQPVNAWNDTVCD
jgi:type IV pilus assembly protein PilA